MFTLMKWVFSLRVDEVFSLKEKRAIVKRLKTHVQKNYNACIAESHHQDSLRYIGITLGILSNKKDGLTPLIDKLTEEVEAISEGFIEEESFLQL